MPDSIQKGLLIGTRFDIVAKVPPRTTTAEANAMLKNLLIERFGLVYHMEKKDFDGYKLTVANGGPKLKPAAPPDGPQWIRPSGTRQPLDDQGFPAFQPGYPNISGGLIVRGVVHMAGRMVTTQDLLVMLGGQLGGARLEDETGLTDKYDLKLEFASQRPRGLPADAAPDPAPDIFSALEQQLGLRLEKIKVPADVVVIDHLNQQPTDN